MISRVWHHWEKWECVKFGMYDTIPPNGMTSDQAKETYAAFLRDLPAFESAIKRVFAEWPISCEHFLTNNINRIAWLGQASICITSGIPRIFRSGFMLLNQQESEAANALAAKYVIGWEKKYQRKGSGVRRHVGGEGLRWRDTGGSASRVDARTTRPVVQGYLFCDFEE